jgi:hypothetical protein
VQPPGRAVRVGPIKPKLKPPGTKRLKLNCDETLSNFAFKFNWCRYNPALNYPREKGGDWRGGADLVRSCGKLWAGAYPRPHFRST